MHKKNTFFASAFLVLFLMLAANTYSQVYSHDFSTPPAVNPYTVTPQVIHPDLSNSSWATNVTNWTALNGQGGNPSSLAITTPSGVNPVYTLTFNVAPNRQLQIDSFNFWRVRSNTGPQNWSMTINGINAGNGTVPTTGAELGTTTVANPVSGLTGTVTIILTLTNATSTGTFRLDNFVLNGTVTSTCTAPAVTSLTPAAGPAGTIVTINGSGFSNGTTSVNFNGTEAAFTVVSNNVITATVPAAAVSGDITITTNSCPGTGPAFTVLTTNCGPAASGTDIYISELYDRNPGSYGIIELYNPTSTTITLNGSYVIERYADIGDATASYTIPLTGSIAPQATFLIELGDANGSPCPGTYDVTFDTGINENDEIKLKKNNVIIDVAHAPAYAGYTVIRTQNAAAPSVAYIGADWTINAAFTCANIGTHITLPTNNAAITTQPLTQSVCENGTATLTVGVANTTGFNFQWKMLNAAGNWVNVMDNSNYSGAATAILTISQVPAGFNGNQYYLEISSATCTLISNAVNITVLPLPAVPALIVTQPTCTIPTGIIAIDNPDAALTYSINGTTGTTFNGLAPDTYIVTVENTDGCTATVSATINVVPNAPAAPALTVTQPTCTIPTGTVAINNPDAALIYSINGTTGTTFSGLTPDTYIVTVENTEGCTATVSATINVVPNAPAAPALTVTQPTCTIPTGTIAIDNPDAALTYSINGSTGTTFSGLAPDTYIVTVENIDGCTATVSATINVVPDAPAVPALTVTQPTCATPAGTIAIDNPDTALTYSINGTTGTTFSGLAPDTYIVTVENSDGCTSVTAPVVINSTVAPIAITAVQGCEDTAFAKQYILHAVPVNNSFNIDEATFVWTAANGMPVGNDQNTFNVTEYVAQNNISPDQFPLEFDVAVTAGGCGASATFIVESSFCTIPRGISPNNDTLNDSFNLTGLNVMNLSIFNRYGKEVYTKGNYSNEWYGQSDSDKELPTGTYYYVIELSSGKTESGWVYLNREG